MVRLKTSIILTIPLHPFHPDRTCQTKEPAGTYIAFNVHIPPNGTLPLLWANIGQLGMLSTVYSLLPTRCSTKASLCVGRGGTGERWSEGTLLPPSYLFSSSTRQYYTPTQIVVQKLWCWRRSPSRCRRIVRNVGSIRNIVSLSATPSPLPQVKCR